jgi:hypothetical protein
MSRPEEALATEMLAAERVQSIEWGHPSLTTLSEPARLIYVCLVDGCSPEALETIAGVELVWRNRAAYAAFATPERRDTCEAICTAVEELIAGGLIVLLDDRSITGGWVRKPWECEPN